MCEIRSRAVFVNILLTSFTAFLPYLLWLWLLLLLLYVVPFKIYFPHKLYSSCLENCWSSKSNSCFRDSIYSLTPTQKEIVALLGALHLVVLLKATFFLITKLLLITLRRTYISRHIMAGATILDEFYYCLIDKRSRVLFFIFVCVCVFFHHQ